MPGLIIEHDDTIKQRRKHIDIIRCFSRDTFSFSKAGKGDKAEYRFNNRRSQACDNMGGDIHHASAKTAAEKNCIVFTGFKVLDPGNDLIDIDGGCRYF
nr:hypothetical protein [Methanoregula sp. PtaU1.Bin006]